MAGVARRPDDPRAARRRLERELAAWVAVFLLVGGGLAIWVVYGPGAAAAGALCLLAGTGTFLGLYGLVALLERWANKGE
jgi:hypothetical protein